MQEKAALLIIANTKKLHDSCLETSCIRFDFFFRKINKMTKDIAMRPAMHLDTIPITSSILRSF